MKKVVTILLGILVAGGAAVCHAESGAALSDGLRARDSAPILREILPDSSRQRISILLGSGVTTLNGETTWSWNVIAGIKLRSLGEFFWGLDLSIDTWRPYAGSGGTERYAEAQGIQVLPSVWYVFENTGFIRPSLGVSAGPYLLRAEKVSGATRGTLQPGLHGKVERTTDVRHMFLLRPGVRAALSESVAASFEPKFGIYDFDFIFLPHLFVSIEF